MSSLNLGKIILLLMFVAGLVSGSSSQPLELFYASTLPDSDVSPLSGSVRGGTRIYINGVGFDSVAENHVVYIGNKLCDMTKAGVNSNFLTCDTTSIGTESNLKSQLITVKIPSTSEQVTLPNHKFDFLTSSTPMLNYVSPSSGPPGSEVRFGGIHRIFDLGDGRSLGDIIGLKIGNLMCGRFDIV